MIQATDHYLQLRGLLGYKDTDLRRDLRDFAAFASAHGSQHLRTVDALAWADLKGQKARRYTLLAAIRRLGVFLAAEDNQHEVIAEEYTRPCRRRRRPAPYIYTESEIRDILGELGALPLAHPYDAATYKHLVGLIAATGLRLSEARNLWTSDLRGPEVHVRKGKFGKDRIVHVHSSTAEALQSYIVNRPPNLTTEKLFVIHNGRTPSDHSIGSMFRRCTSRLGMTGRTGTGLPRIHDLRHTFAVRSLASCSSDRAAISNHMVALSTYLGHVSVASTYWYLEISAETKEAMALAMEEVLHA